MAGGGNAAKVAPLWDAAALKADKHALENPLEDPARTAAAMKRCATALGSAINGRSQVAALFPANGRQRDEKASPAYKMRRQIYRAMISRIAPNQGAAGDGKTLKVSEIHRTINSLIENYKLNIFPFQENLISEPPRGEYGYDDLLWQLFRLPVAARVSDPTMREIIRTHFPIPHGRGGKRRRN